MGALRGTILLIAVWVAPGLVAAQAGDPEAAARAEFEAGVEASGRADWEAAAAHFASSIDRVPRLAAAYNLAIANAHLRRHVDVAATVDRVCQLADPERHAELLGEVERLRTDALRHLGMVQLTLAPAGASVAVDAECEPDPSGRTGERTDGLNSAEAHLSCTGSSRPGSALTRVADGVRELLTIYLDPGPHRIRITSPEHEAQTIAVTARAGVSSRLRVTLELSRERTPPLRLPLNPYPETGSVAVREAPDEERRVIAGALWASGALASLSGLVLACITWSDAERLAEADPSVGGFLSQSHRYREQRAATIGLAVTSGLLAGAASLVWPWRGDEEAAWWVALSGAALLVTGSVLLIRPPDRLGQTRLTGPARALGSVLVSAGASLALAPVGAWVDAQLGAPPSGAGLNVAGSF